jgi:hypothetical protein
MMRESRPSLTKPFTVSETISHQSIKETASGCGLNYAARTFLAGCTRKSLRRHNSQASGSGFPLAGHIKDI